MLLKSAKGFIRFAGFSMQCAVSHFSKIVSGMRTNDRKVQVINYLVSELHMLSVILKVNLTYEFC